jgi:hypothetical protein
MKRNINYKKELDKFTKIIISFENALDKEMENPSSFERGKRIASLINKLSLKNQLIMHFILDYSLEEIEKLYSQKE